MLPKAAYGFIQCKQHYITQDELLAVAKGYRDRHLPLDVLVVDWFYYTRMGQFDMEAHSSRVIQTGRKRTAPNAARVIPVTLQGGPQPLQRPPVN